MFLRRPYEYLIIILYDSVIFFWYYLSRAVDLTWRDVWKLNLLIYMIVSIKYNRSHAGRLITKAAFQLRIKNSM